MKLTHITSAHAATNRESFRGWSSLIVALNVIKHNKFMRTEIFMATVYNLTIMKLTYIVFINYYVFNYR